MTIAESAKHRAHRREPSRYEDDFVRWCFDQAELLRRNRLTALDAPNLIEELESMGNEQRHALRSSYRLIMMHLLKWQFQPEKRTRSWRVTITRERVNVSDREKDSKTLRDQADALVTDAYRGAVLRAADETGLARDVFPTDCPYALDQLRDPDWMPE